MDEFESMAVCVVEAELAGEGVSEGGMGILLQCTLLLLATVGLALVGARAKGGVCDVVGEVLLWCVDMEGAVGIGSAIRGVN